MRMVATAMLAVAMTTACATAGGGGQRTTHNRIVYDEIQRSDQTNALDVIKSMRPQWLRTRGPTTILGSDPVMLYIDGMRMNYIDELQTIPRMNIQEIRYYPASEAQAKWGLNHTNGAIEVITRRG